MSALEYEYTIDEVNSVVGIEWVNGGMLSWDYGRFWNLKNFEKCKKMKIMVKMMW